MKFPTSILATALLIGSSLAAPRSGLEERIERRARAARQSQPMQRVLTSDTTHKAISNVQYSNNWAGAVYENPPPEGPFTAVSGTFTVPEPKTDGKANGKTAGSAWVGIDVDTYGDAILQAGVDFYVEPDGSTSFDAWYEWFPDYAYDFEMDVQAGDEIYLWIESYTPSQGLAYIENLTTGESASQELSAPSDNAVLAGQNAEWIVEDFQSGGKLVNLVDFGTVTFTDVQAFSGHKVNGVQGATRIELKQGEKVLTETNIENDSVFHVKYVG